MSRMRPKPAWWSWKTYGGRDSTERRINRKGQRRVEGRLAQREINEEMDGVATASATLYQNQTRSGDA